MEGVCEHGDGDAGGTSVWSGAVVGVDREVDVALLDERIGVLAAQIHALSAELVETVAGFSAAGGWQGGGYRSLSHWLSVRTKLSVAEARRLVAVVERVGELPTLMAHARLGEVSVGVLASAARVVSGVNEAAVARVALSCTPAQSQRVFAKFRESTSLAEQFPDHPEFADAGGSGAVGSSGAVGDIGEAAPAPASAPVAEPEYWWRSWTDAAGRGRLDAALDAPTAALMHQAWLAARAAGEREHATDTNAGTDMNATAGGVDADRSAGPSAAGVGSGAGRGAELVRLGPNEVAARLAATMLDHAHDVGVCAPGGERFVVQVSVDVVTLARALGISFDPALGVQLGAHAFDACSGVRFDDAQLAAMACEGAVQVLVHHDGAPLWLSNETRSATRQQRRALRFRASGGGCEFPGCP